MANVKKLIAHTDTGSTVYCMINREADGYLLDNADGAFAPAPADPYLSLVEDGAVKGKYAVSESRTVWDDGRYTITAYKQTGGSPAPVDDNIIGTGEMTIENDLEVFLSVDMARVLGLVTENLVEEVTSRDSNGNKTASTIYLYDSAANAISHDKVTGLKATYNVTASYTNNLMDLFKNIKAL